MNITVGDLIKELKNFDAELEVSFSELEYNGLKQRSDTCVQVKFYPHVYQDKNTGQLVIENSVPD